MIIKEGVAVYDGRSIEWMEIQLSLPVEHKDGWSVELTIERLGLIAKPIVDVSAMQALLMVPKALAVIYSSFFPGSTVYMGPKCSTESCIFRPPLEAFGLAGLRFEDE